jgi:hypothetical protein
VHCTNYWVSLHFLLLRSCPCIDLFFCTCSVQLLSTVDGGPASLLSVLCASASPHTPSSSTGKAASYAQVYLIDTRAAREIAAKVMSVAVHARVIRCRHVELSNVRA